MRTPRGLPTLLFVGPRLWAFFLILFVTLFYKGATICYTYLCWAGGDAVCANVVLRCQNRKEKKWIRKENRIGRLRPKNVISVKNSKNVLFVLKRMIAVLVNMFGSGERQKKR